MNHKELYNLLKTVKKNMRCPQCGKEYSFSQIRIRGIADMVVFLEMSCSDHMPVLATVALSKPLPVKDKEAKVIDADDVINAYSFLESFDGGFDKIFKNSKNIRNK